MISKRQGLNALLVFSEADISSQLEEIAKQALKAFDNVSVIYLGTRESLLWQNLKGIDAQLILIEKSHKKYDFLRLLKTVFHVNYQNRHQTVFSSGLMSNLAASLISSVFKIENRISLRHHSYYHQLRKSTKGVIYDRIISTLSTKIIAVSDSTRDAILEIDSVKPEKVITIYNGFDTSKFIRLRDENVELSETQRSFRIGCISRQTHSKGIEYIVEAFEIFNSKVTNSELVLIGAESDATEKINEMLLNLDPSKFSIIKHSDNIQMELSKVDVMVHVPIGVNEESFGLVYLETLAAGKKCIFTCSGIMYEDNRLQKYSKIVKFCDAKDIEVALFEFHHNRKIKSEVAPLELINEYSLEVMGDKYLDLFNSL
jgi:glycosyltransferase involved in cell wall biosynthesis